MFHSIVCDWSDSAIIEKPRSLCTVVKHNTTTKYSLKLYHCAERTNRLPWSSSQHKLSISSELVFIAWPLFSIALHFAGVSIYPVTHCLEKVAAVQKWTHSIHALCLISNFQKSHWPQFPYELCCTTFLKAVWKYMRASCASSSQIRDSCIWQSHVHTSAWWH